MFRRFGWIALAVALASFATAHQDDREAEEPAPAPAVRVAGVTELRAAGQPAIDDWPGRPPHGLFVLLRVDNVADAGPFGTVVLTEAVDDTGKELVAQPVAGAGSLTKLQPVRAAAGAGGGAGVPRDGFDVRLVLALPARHAKRVATLKGELRLKVGRGEAARVTIPNVRAACGTTVEHAALAEAGVTVQLGAHSRLAPRELAVLVSGEVADDVQVSVTDAQGKNVSGGGSGSLGTSSKSLRVELRRPLADSDALMVTLPAAQEPLTIPFELNDIELP